TEFFMATAGPILAWANWSVRRLGATSVTRISCRCIIFVSGPAPTGIYALSLHDALPISQPRGEQEQPGGPRTSHDPPPLMRRSRSEEHTSELQSRGHLVCRLLLEKKHTLPGIDNVRRQPTGSRHQHASLTKSNSSSTIDH